MRIQHLIAVPLLLAALAGCGGKASAGDDGIASADSGTPASPQPSSSPGAGASLSPEQRQLKFAQCMRANGVDMPDPDPNGNPGMVKIDRGDPKFEAAYDKCKEFAPFGNGDRTLSPQDQQRMLDMTKCMREHGINLPDPDPNQGGIKIDKNSGINPDDPKFKAAMEACRQYMPQRPGTK